MKYKPSSTCSKSTEEQVFINRIRTRSVKREKTTVMIMKNKSVKSGLLNNKMMFCCWPTCYVTRVVAMATCQLTPSMSGRIVGPSQFSPGTARFLRQPLRQPTGHGHQAPCHCPEAVSPSAEWQPRMSLPMLPMTGFSDH